MKDLHGMNPISIKHLIILRTQNLLMQFQVGKKEKNASKFDLFFWKNIKT